MEIQCIVFYMIHGEKLPFDSFDSWFFSPQLSCFPDWLRGDMIDVHMACLFNLYLRRDLCPSFSPFLVHFKHLPVYLWPSKLADMDSFDVKRNYLECC